MPNCPYCKCLTSTLSYLQYHKGKGEIALQKIITMKIEEEIKITRPTSTIETIYVLCPTCRKVLFTNLVKAAKWLITGEYIKEQLPEECN